LRLSLAWVPSVCPSSPMLTPRPCSIIRFYICGAAVMFATSLPASLDHDPTAYILQRPRLRPSVEMSRREITEWHNPPEWNLRLDTDPAVFYPGHGRDSGVCHRVGVRLLQGTEEDEGACSGIDAADGLWGECHWDGHLAGGEGSGFGGVLWGVGGDHGGDCWAILVGF